ncbi:ParB N-terminal domain-containing protein [Devriesea agamarum]|uniref:ParB N-terminal domain-containing protein n=1 Tax=Devriesea agamarum TaxID=472569 RepID=UPI00071E147A|nr:ParB N-terminal domain-containing protein [Devriesea agamarum]
MHTLCHEEVRLSELLWHEQVDSEHVDALRKDLSTSTLRWPILATVYRGQKIILDGAHRALAARQLGWTHIPATVISLPAHTRIPSWSYVLDSLQATEIPPHLASDDTRPLGCVSTWGQRRFLGQRPHHTRHLFTAVHAVASQLQLGFARRVPSTLGLDPAIPVFTWTPLLWRDIAQLAMDYGPLPSGITQFAPILLDKNLATGSLWPPPRSEHDDVALTIPT